MHTITLTNPDSAMIHEGTDPPEDPIIESEVKTEVWAREVTEGSLPEVFSTIEVPRDGHWTRTFLSFVGPGSLVAVGYMDPGNWSTDLAGGATYGYKLLFVILLSSLIAMFLQYLAIKVGFATGRDLAQCCRDYFTSKPLLYMLWFVSELAICACDLAEVIGSAIALNLLFGLPIIAGVCITAADVLLILFLQNKRFEWIERLVLALVSTITVCFIVQLVLSKPDAIGVLKGFVPSAEIFSNKDILYVAIGIIGATVMPHNLFLHSSLVLTRVPPILLLSKVSLYLTSTCRNITRTAKACGMRSCTRRGTHACCYRWRSLSIQPSSSSQQLSFLWMATMISQRCTQLDCLYLCTNCPHCLPLTLSSKMHTPS
jgi:hypothetical protein